MSRPVLSLFVLFAATLLAFAGSSPEKPPVPAVVNASDAEVKTVLENWDKATKDKNEEMAVQVLGDLETLKSDQFVPIIRAGLKMNERVQTLALRAAASHGMKDVEKEARADLRKKVGGSKKDAVQGALAAAACDYLVRLEFAGDEAIVLDELLIPLFGDQKRMRAAWAKDMARACVHYLGRFKVKRAVPQLIEMVWEPIPENPNDPKNPPAAYWEARTMVWQVSESWARWALKEITGKEFRSAREWRAWLELNKKEYGGK